VTKYKVHHNVIIACDQYGTIGNQGKLPWPNLSGDLKRFRELTDGHVVVMGRKTWQSLPMFPRGLPKRTNVVITEDPEHYRRFSNINLLPRTAISGVTFTNLADSWDVLQELADFEQKDIYVFHIGGVKLIETMLDSGLIEALFITLVHKPYPGDAAIKILPEILFDASLNKNPRFKVVNEEEHGDHTFYKLIAKT
jgi:dihydrofolate reductase